jgi:ribosomal protein S18 acetylase RimI-like enzyme
MPVVVRNAGPADAAGIARVECEAWRDAYPGLVPERYLIDVLDETRRAAYWRRRLSHGDGQRIVLAAAAGQILGYAVFGPCRVGRLPFAGEIYELYLLPEQRDRGLGRRLCAEAAGRLAKAGMTSFCVEVLEGNPSRFFYQALGGRLAARNCHPFGGRPLPTLIYGWDDIGVIAGERTQRNP